jgi:hypothetical protein
MLISIERAGRVRAKNMIPNAHKCAAMSTKVYHYWCRIEASDTKLSPEGYVFNNERVQEFFENKFGMKAAPWDAISCERMALVSAQEICEQLLAEGIDVHCVKVTITGSNGAKITAEYRCKEVAV